jgi:hypothetical protein
MEGEDVGGDSQESHAVALVQEGSGHGWMPLGRPWP